MHADRLFAFLPNAACSIGLALATCCSFDATAGEVDYSGTLGKQPIKLFAIVYGDGVVHGVYAYDRHDTPIRLDGRVADSVLSLQEKGTADRTIATLHFDAFTEDRTEVAGEWIAANGTKRLPITLRRTFPNAPGANDGEREVIQAAAARDEYFTLVPDDATDSWSMRAIELRVYRKGTDELLQSIELDSEWRGLDSVSVGDFNFDGVADISVFDGSYAGPNTSSRYFLRDGDKYVDSGWSGVSLEFDTAAKLVHEHNQCCAGRSHMNTTYKVVGDKLVQIEQTCLEWDDAKDDLVETACGE